MSGRRFMAAAAILVLGLAPAGPAEGFGRRPSPPAEGEVRARVLVRPDSARIGQPVSIRYEVRTPGETQVAFAPRPADDSTWTWQGWRLLETEVTPEGLFHRLEATALPFRTGALPVPAPRYTIARAGTGARAGSFPRVTIPVASVLSPEDPTPEVRGLKPPFEAPWWKRFPWWIPALVLALAALAWWLWRRRRRRPAAVAKPAPAATPAVAAHTEALAALEALRAERLPEAGRWYEHQSRLAEIVRRFLERRFGSPEPGYTTRELCLHLAWQGLSGEQVERLRSLLRVADLAKFARSDPGVERAHRHEEEARALILAWTEASAPAPAEDALERAV